MVDLYSLRAAPSAMEPYPADAASLNLSADRRSALQHRKSRPEARLSNKNPPTKKRPELPPGAFEMISS
jgi:hypothetical protein